jgi:hypothetical protein
LREVTEVRAIRKREWVAMFIWIIMLSLIVSCSNRSYNNFIHQSVKMHGIELEMELKKTYYELNEPAHAHIRVTNHSDEPRIFTVVQRDLEQNVAMVVVMDNEWMGRFQGEPLEETIGERGKLNNLFVYKLEPGQSLEQDFSWNQSVLDPLNPGHEVLGPSGEYRIFAEIMYGEMTQKLGESMEQMLERYNNHPLGNLKLEYPITISGNREIMSIQEAIRVAMENQELKNWFQARTYEDLVKKEKGKWYVKDVDGSWVQGTKESAQQLKKAEPSFIGGERDESRIRLNYESFLGGSPHRMSVVIDTNENKVKTVGFSD